MKREGAINTLRKFPIGLMDLGSKEKQDITEAIDMALAALRIPTREQVEAWKGEWIPYLDGEHIMPERYYSCSKCGNRGYQSKKNFCVFCGAPMTDEAVEIILRRLEALHENDH